MRTGQGGGEGTGSDSVGRYGISFGADENVLKFMVVTVVQLCEYTKKHCID